MILGPRKPPPDNYGPPKMTDLDNLTMPTARNPGMEIYDPQNAWPSAPARIYLQINPLAGGVYQTGYDPATERYWLRSMRYAGGGWSAWKTTTGGQDPPVPINGSLGGDKRTITIGFDLTLDPNSVPAADAFTIVCNTQTRPTLTVAMMPPDGVYLTVAADMPFSSAIDVSYIAPGTGQLRSVDGVNVASFQNFRIQ